MNIKTLRFVGTLEGISFLLLLGVAMPIKYIWDNPIFVKYIGMGHGVLFLLFLAVLLVVCHRMKWSLSILTGFDCCYPSLLALYFDRKIKKLAEAIISTPRLVGIFSIKNAPSFRDSAFFITKN